MIKSNIDVIVNNSCCCALSTYRTVVLKCNMIGNDNILTQDMIETPYTKYVVKYDYIIDPNPIVGVANIDTLKEDCCSGKTYYYWRTLISLRKGQSITIPEGCVLLNNNLTAELDIIAADKDIDVYIASETPGSYNYRILLSLIIPEKCIIQFDGGSISNGTLVGNKTILLSFLKNENVLKNVELKGTFTNVFEIQEEIITEQPGEKIIPVYKRITLRSGREKVAFNVCSFEVLDILRIIRFGGTNYIIELAKGENQFIFPTAQEAGVNKTLIDGWIINGIHYYPGDTYTITDPDIEELIVEPSGWVYTITFISKYGDVASSIEVTNCMNLEPIVLSEPTIPNPKAPCYTAIFDGWYLDSDYTSSSKLGSEYCPEENTTIYAKWIENVKTIRIYESSESSTYIERRISEGENINLCNIYDSDNMEDLNIKQWAFKNSEDTFNTCIWSPSNGAGLYEIFPVYNVISLMYHCNRRTGHTEDKSISATYTEQINPGEDVYPWFPSDWLENNEIFHWWYASGTFEGNVIWPTTRTRNYNNSNTNINLYTYINNIIEVTFKFDNELSETISYDLTNSSQQTIQFSNISSLYLNSGRVVTGWKIVATGDSNTKFWYADRSIMPKSTFGANETFSLIEKRTINGHECNVMPGSLTFNALTEERDLRPETLTLKSWLDESDYLNHLDTPMSFNPLLKNTNFLGNTVDSDCIYHIIESNYEIEVLVQSFSGNGSEKFESIGGSYADGKYTISGISLNGKTIKFNYK